MDRDKRLAEGEAGAQGPSETSSPQVGRAGLGCEGAGEVPVR